MKYILTIDQGTTGTTAMIWDEKGDSLASVNLEHQQYYPHPGWVEHDPEEIWLATIESSRQAIESAGIDPSRIVSLGITNQRETCVFWDRKTGKPLFPAIVWQCRRSASTCEELKKDGHEPTFREKTGLLLDPYFSGTKVRWALNNSLEVKEAALKGNLLFGTIDTWLIYKLTGNSAHVTDYTNASRTLLYNLKELKWDSELLDILKIPQEVLPEVLPSSGIFGETSPEAFLGLQIPIGGVAGDQQAALFGQACFEPGMAKNTYGTGGFLLVNTGDKFVKSRNGLLTTIAWGIDNKVEYALEGSVFIAGASVQWLRDELGIIQNASDVNSLCANLQSNDGVYLVPAFVGMGAPYWDPYARGIIVGITRGTGRAHIARAAVEAMAYQSRDVLDLMNKESGIPLKELRVDGGASRNDFLLQFQADMVDIPVRRPAYPETTSLGAAYLAGLAVNVWKDRAAIASLWKEDVCFMAKMVENERDKYYRGWKKAVARSLKWIDED